MYPIVLYSLGSQALRLSDSSMRKTRCTAFRSHLGFPSIGRVPNTTSQSTARSFIHDARAIVPSKPRWARVSKLIPSWPAPPWRRASLPSPSGCVQFRTHKLYYNMKSSIILHLFYYITVYAYAIRWLLSPKFRSRKVTLRRYSWVNYLIYFHRHSFVDLLY